MYSVMEGESVTAVVSVVSDGISLDRDVVVTLMTADSTATTGQFYIYIPHARSCQYMKG